MIAKFDSLKRKLSINGALVYAATLAWVFWAVYQFSDKSRLITVMNAFVVGAIVSLVVSYCRIIWFYIATSEPWNRARQFGISSAVAWAGIFIVVLASVIRHSGTSYNPASTNFLDLFSRYLFIVAATMQVFAPGYGQGQTMFYSAERKALIWGTVAGVVVALVIIVVQAENLLDW